MLEGFFDVQPDAVKGAGPLPVDRAREHANARGGVQTVNRLDLALADRDGPWDRNPANRHTRHLAEGRERREEGRARRGDVDVGWKGCSSRRVVGD